MKKAILLTLILALTSVASATTRRSAGVRKASKTPKASFRAAPRASVKGQSSASSSNNAVGQVNRNMVPNRAFARYAGETDAPAPQGGALISTAGETRVAAGSPEQTKFVEAGGIISEEPKGDYINPAKGLHIGAADKQPGSGASGNNSIKPNN